MRSLLFLLGLLTCASKGFAGEKDIFFNPSIGYFNPKVINLTLATEYELRTHNALDLYVELYHQFGDCDLCGNVCRDSFWKSFNSLSVGMGYKTPLFMWPYQSLRFRSGGDLGFDRHGFLGTVDLGLEYTYILSPSLRFFILQKNDFVFRHGVKFFNGIQVGLKIPLK